MATLPSKSALADLSGGYYSYWTDGDAEGRATLSVILGSTDAAAAAATLGSLTLATPLANDYVAGINQNLLTTSSPTFAALTVGQQLFDTSAGIESNAAGEMSWDEDAETVMLALNDNIHMHVGQDSLYHALNQTGSDIAKGTAVYATGTVGNSGKITIAPFTADGTYDSKYFMGVTAEAITNGSTGFVVHFGKIRQLNTNAFEEGDILYADPSTAGGLTNVRPAAPNNIITVAIVVTKSATVGELFVRPTFVDGFADNEDVTITSATTGDLLRYNGTVWVNYPDSNYSPVAGSTSITTVGTIGTGVWQGTAIDSAYIDPTLSVTSLTTSGAASIGTTLGVTGAATFSSTVSVPQGSALYLDGGSDSYVYSPSSDRVDVVAGGLQIANFTNSAGTRIFAAQGNITAVGNATIASTLTLASGSITDSSGSISFGNENLSTTGTLASGAATVSGNLTVVNGRVRVSSGYNIGSTDDQTGIYTNANTFYAQAGGTAFLTATSTGASITGTLGVSGAARFGTSAVTADADADEFVIEATSAKSGMSVIGADGNATRYVLGSTSLAFGAGLTWNYNADSFQIGTQKATASTVLTSGANATALTLDSSQNATFAGDVTVTGTGTFNTALTVGGASATTSQRLQFADTGGIEWHISYLNGDGLYFLEQGIGDTRLKLLDGGGVTLPTGDLTLSAGDLTVAATQRIYLDGGGDTYLYESSGNNITMAAGAGFVDISAARFQYTGGGYAYFAGDLRIGTTSATSHGGEVLRVARAGSSSPMVSITATDGNQAFLGFYNTDTGSTANDGFYLGVNNDESVALVNQESTVMRFYTAGTERLRIASDANAIGIGTTNVKSWASTYAAVDFGNSAIMGSVTQTNALNILHGAYYDGAYKHTNTGTKASAINMNDGNVIFRSAGTGTADGSLQGTGSWSETVRITDGGMLLVGDTANTDMTVGLTINQGSNDDEAFALKSSGDVAHGLTFLQETDTYFSARKSSATLGGTYLYSVAEDDAIDVTFGVLSYGGTADTGKTTSANGLIDLYASEHDGANSVANITADGNVFAVRGRVGAANRTLFIIDEDGDYHYDGADGGAFDAYQDAHLVRAFANATSKETVRTAHDDWVQYNEQTLVDIGVLGAPVSEGGLINGAQLQRVHTGAIWQNYMAISDTKTEVEVLRDRLADTESRLAIAESKLKQLPAA